MTPPSLYVEIHGWRSSVKYRRSEWGLALIMMCAWGVNLLFNPTHTFSTPAFSVMREIAPEWAWGIACLVVGAARLIVLIINGRWKKCSHARMICAAVSTFLWVGMFLGFFLANVGSTGTVVYLVFAVMEANTIYEAAQDAREADDRNAAAI